MKKKLKDCTYNEVNKFYEKAVEDKQVGVISILAFTYILDSFLEEFNKPISPEKCNLEMQKRIRKIKLGDMEIEVGE